MDKRKNSKEDHIVPVALSLLLITGGLFYLMAQETQKEDISSEISETTKTNVPTTGEIIFKQKSVCGNSICETGEQVSCKQDCKRPELNCQIIQINEVKNGEETCKQNDFSTCLLVNLRRQRTYFESLDASCSGKTQTTFLESSMTHCTQDLSTLKKESCFSDTSQEKVEPYAGDVSIKYNDIKGEVVCCVL